MLVEYRKRKGMSRSDLAAAADLSYPYVSQLETGMRKPSREAVAKLARGLGIDPLDFEALIPTSDGGGLEPRRVREVTARLNSSLGLEGPPDSSDEPGSPGRLSASIVFDRDVLIGEMLDLLEEFDAEERFDVLSELQRRAMKNIVAEQSRRT
ncbi:helix-turn-helix transcriptional regulator [Aeromicrobium sp. NPDC092404]|uniref:helix-turn-helix domain-containing protein n=1 Tax=Aeromicrobium sp. NPDC092404 TaxID=3154976 RepID=UPI003436B42A